MARQAGAVDNSRLAWDPGREYEVLDKLIYQHGNTVWEGTHQEITKIHWKPNTTRSACSNRNCKKKFTLTERQHHCRRCGDLFCKECLSFQRRLNLMAHLDPQGKLYKVCQRCFDLGPQTLGQSRDWMQWFQYFKTQPQSLSQHHPAQANSTSLTGDLPPSLAYLVPSENLRYNRINLDEECSRLKEGFKKTVNSKLPQAFSDVKGIVSTPDWQRCRFWLQEKLMPYCRDCKEKFGVTRTRNFCCVCGTAICSSCSNKDLLVYVPDDQSGDTYKTVSLSIIKIVGGPEKEPSLCTYLRICKPCHKRLEEKQVAQYYSDNDTTADDNNNSWSGILGIHDKLSGTRAKIDALLPNYQLVVEALEGGTGSNKTLPSGQSHVQTLAKAQCDLGDHFSQYVMVLVPLKKLSPKTSGQASILRNMVKACCTFYMDNMWTFRDLQRKLEDFTPREILDAIQHEVNKKAINSGYVAMKQLAMEVFHLCSKHKLSDGMVQYMLPVEQVMQKDLEKIVTTSQEDWTDHSDCLKQLLQLQLKERRLIRPSKRLTQKHGSSHIHQVIEQRSQLLVQQVLLQLQSKCADRSFRETKEALEQLLQQLSLAACDDQMDEDFVLLKVSK